MQEFEGGTRQRQRPVLSRLCRGFSNLELPSRSLGLTWDGAGKGARDPMQRLGVRVAIDSIPGINVIDHITKTFNRNVCLLKPPADMKKENERENIDSRLDI